MKATMNVLRDGSDLFFVFTGDIDALSVFKTFPMTYGGNRGQVIRGEGGEKMAAMVACDFLRDRGVDVDTDRVRGF